MTHEKFHEDMCNDVNHRILLWQALNSTKGAVVEYGSGHGSTPYLRAYCRNQGRKFLSYDFNKDWSEKMQSTLVMDWATVHAQACGSVILIDHSPGEDRKHALKALANSFDILVIHDTEPTGAGDYQVRPLFKEFKYVAEIPTDGAWTTAVSNVIDITAWDGITYTAKNGKVYTIKAGIQTVTQETTDQRK